MTDDTAYEWLFGSKSNPITRGVVRPSSAGEARRRHVDGRGYGVLLRRTCGLTGRSRSIFRTATGNHFGLPVRQ